LRKLHLFCEKGAFMKDTTEAIVSEIETVGRNLSAAKHAISDRIYGQDDVIEQTLITILSGGHGLLVGVPGLAKTRLVETIGIVMGLNAKRVQFTPDLMPADIIGAEVLEDSTDGKRSFRFIEGPIFAQLLMADEINRASPRTQSALLQAMQEKYVTVAGEHHTLPKPFHVLATQNPLEHEGTYPLPEAQLDRFLMQIDIDYPDEEAERLMLIETTGASERDVRTVLSSVDLMAATDLVRRMPIGESVVDGILTLVRSARPGPDASAGINNTVAWGPGPRASQALMLAVRARALIQGRMAPSLDDVIALAEPVLRHRMSLTFTARAEGQSLGDIIKDLCRPIS
jgi:MoxR-like ATPase